MNLTLLASELSPAQIINQLFPNLWVFITHIIATVLLLILLTKFFYNPFRKAMRARRNKIHEILQDAADKQTQANVNQKEAIKMLDKAKLDATTMISTARSQAEQKRQQILEQAREEVIRLNEQNKKEMQKEWEKYQDDIRKSIINVAFETAGKLLHKEIDTSKHQELVEEFIKSLD